MTAPGELWAILYGAGDCEPEALGRSIERIAGLIPKKRILVVATPESCEAHRAVLAALPAKNSLFVPIERGAPAALLLSFFHLFRAQPSARVLFIPAAHQVEDEAAFLRVLQATADAAPGSENRAVLVGLKSNDAFVPGALIYSGEDQKKGTERVLRLDCSIDIDVRTFAVERGATIFSGIFAASSSSMLRLYEHALPGLLRSFLSQLRGQTTWSDELLSRLFRFLPKKQLGEDLLEPSADFLRVMLLESSGYRNLLERERVLPKLLMAEPHRRIPDERQLRLLPT
jgi:mannose-1-phosphate guanylyltransferase